MQIELKRMLKRWNINRTVLAEMLGYKTINSMYGSSAYTKRMLAVEALIAHIQDELVKRIKS